MFKKFRRKRWERKVKKIRWGKKIFKNPNEIFSSEGFEMLLFFKCTSVKTLSCFQPVICPLMCNFACRLSLNYCNQYSLILRKIFKIGSSAMFFNHQREMIVWVKSKSWDHPIMISLCSCLCVLFSGLCVLSSSAHVNGATHAHPSSCKNLLLLEHSAES